MARASRRRPRPSLSYAGRVWRLRPQAFGRLGERARKPLPFRLILPSLGSRQGALEDFAFCGSCARPRPVLNSYIIRASEALLSTGWLHCRPIRPSCQRLAWCVQRRRKGNEQKVSDTPCLFVTSGLILTGGVSRHTQLPAFNTFTWGAGLTHISYIYNIYKICHLRCGSLAT